MVTHLASLAENRLIISFAPYTPYYAVLKRIGELFPGPSKVRTRQRRRFCRRQATLPWSLCIPCVTCG